MSRHIFHRQELTQAHTLTHEDVIDIEPTAAETFKVPAALGENDVGLLQRPAQFRPDFPQFCAGDGRAAVDNFHQAIHPHTASPL